MSGQRSHVQILHVMLELGGGGTHSCFESLSSFEFGSFSASDSSLEVTSPSIAPVVSFAAGQPAAVATMSDGRKAREHVTREIVNAKRHICVHACHATHAHAYIYIYIYIYIYRCTHACARCVSMHLTYTHVSHAHAAQMTCHSNTRACSCMTC